MKTLIKRALGITELEGKILSLERENVKLRDLLDIEVVELEREMQELEDILKEQINDMRDDIDMNTLTREDVAEISTIENEEAIQQSMYEAIKNMEARNFDYDLVVSKVLSIIAEKFNK
jgi:cell shape-determining protein MreC